MLSASRSSAESARAEATGGATATACVNAVSLEAAAAVLNVTPFPSAVGVAPAPNACSTSVICAGVTADPDTSSFATLVLTDGSSGTQRFGPKPSSAPRYAWSATYASTQTCAKRIALTAPLTLS